MVMRIVTSDRKITSLASSTLEAMVERYTWPTTVTMAESSETRGNTLLRGMPRVENWDQIPHAEFVDGIDKGVLMPIWARTVESTSTQSSYGYPKAYSTVDMHAMPIWALEAVVDKQFQDYNVNSANYTRLGNLLSDVDADGKLAFPVRANIMHYVSNASPAHVARHQYEVVGGLVWNMPNCVPVTLVDDPLNSSYPGGMSVVVFTDIPTNWSSFMNKIRARMERSRDVVNQTFLANQQRYIDDIIRPHFESNMNREECLTQPFCFFRNGTNSRFTMAVPSTDSFSLGGTNTITMQSPMSNSGSFVRYKMPWKLNAEFMDLPLRLNTPATSEIQKSIPGAKAGIDLTDTSLVKLCRLLSEPLDFFRPPYEGTGLTEIEATWTNPAFATATGAPLKFLDIYEYSDEITALGSNALNSYAIDGDVVRDPEGNVVPALAGNVKDLIDPKVSKGVLGDSTMTEVWRLVIGDLEDALKADVE